MNKNREAGKGQKPIPLSISREEYEKRWEETFRKDKSTDINKCPQNVTNDRTK